MVKYALWRCSSGIFTKRTCCYAILLEFRNRLSCIELKCVNIGMYNGMASKILKIQTGTLKQVAVELTSYPSLPRASMLVAQAQGHI
jgi:hypothetical protein